MNFAAMQKALDKLSAGHEVRGTAALVLIELSQRDARMTDLARRCSVSPASMTGIVDRLKEKGLVLRREHKEDRRSLVICLSAEGVRTMKQVAAAAMGGAQAV